MNEVDKIFTKEFEKAIVEVGWKIVQRGYCVYKTKTEKSGIFNYGLVGQDKLKCTFDSWFEAAEIAEEATRRQI